MTPIEFCRDFRRQKTKVPGLSCGVICAIHTFSRFSICDGRTDEQKDGQTDTRRQLTPALARVERVKTVRFELRLVAYRTLNAKLYARN